MRLPLSKFKPVFVAAFLAGCAASGYTPNNLPAAVVRPAFTAQPQSQTVSPGTSATFTATVEGTAPLSYQWLKNGANISGAISPAYSTPPTSVLDTGSTFELVVSNVAGSATSAPATLTINPLSLRSYSTKFLGTENPLSERGNWINGGEAGLSWSNVRTTPDLAFGTQSGSNGYDDSIAVLNGSWNPDQMAQGIVHTANQNPNVFQEVELRLRTSIAAQRITGYGFSFRSSSNGNTYVQIVRWEGPLGSFSILAETPGPGIGDGDLIKATVVGDILTAYVNGVQVLQATDSSFSNGSPGLGFFNHGGSVEGNSDFGLQNFYAAELSLPNH